MDEAALVARANEEREKLFLRYDHGREPGADIDPWEDPGFEVYHQTDRYGFIHDKRLPKKTDPNEAKAKQIEMERVKKWLKMTSKWDSKKTTEVLHKRIYKGVPDSLRSRVWIKLLNIEKIMNENKNVYQKMLKLARQWSTEARQIDSDVNRQFREHLFYRERYSIKQKSLFNILTAYSMYNMEVGYCQGMSGVAGVLLMYMNEEEAFWALSILLSDKRYAMHGLYIEGFPKLTRFLAHHDNIIAKFLPKLKKHFDQYNLDSILYSLKWFFVIFIERIPFSLCLRVWDIYLMDGERVVTAMAYTILRLHKNKLLKLKDMDLIVQYLQSKLHKDFGYDDDYVVKMLEQSMDELRKSKMDLPAPPQANEFPKKPFGVFIEPNFEAKVGIRKSIFTETEKEVTDTVILRREITQQELAESQLSVEEATDVGSNNHINTVGHIPPESEDGGSLLGSSRKSLADTSVTSTADLSVFSGGQRSQHAYDICVDDVRSILSEGDDGEGESSPGSAFCSLSIIGRTPSAMMITPTIPSTHDVVRIYVPPAPPDEILLSDNNSTTTTKSLHQHQQRNNARQSSESSSSKTTPIKDRLINMSASRISLHSTTELTNGDGSIINGQRSNRASIISGDATPVRRSLNRFDEDLINNFNIELLRQQQNGQRSTSSSRRGSLSRKSPPAVLETEFGLMECAHIKAARRQSNEIDGISSNTMKIQLNSNSNENVSDYRQYHTIVDQLKKSNNTTTTLQYGEIGNIDGKKKMTSFEELAKLDAINSRMTKSDIQQQYNDNIDDGGGRCYGTLTYSYSNKLMNNINNDTTSVQYRPFDNIDIDYETLNRRSNENDDDNATSVKYEMFSSSTKETAAMKGATTKTPFNRFYSGDDDDERLKSSDESSSSPNSKSILNTPVNETVPLLTSSPTTTTPKTITKHTVHHQHHQQQHRDRKLIIKENDDYDEDDDDDDDDDDEDDIDGDGSPSAITPILSPTSPPLTGKHPFSPTYTTKTFVPPSSSSSSMQQYEKKLSQSSNNVRPSRIPLYHSPISPVSDLNTILPPVEIGHSTAAAATTTALVSRLRSPKSPLSDYGGIVSVGVSSSDHRDYDSRHAVPLGGAYEFNRNRQNSLNKSKNSTQTNTATDINKIRIKINQNQRQ